MNLPRCLERTASISDNAYRKRAASLRSASLGREAIVEKVNPYELHGVRYYQFFLSYPEAPGRVQEVRLPHDAVYAEPMDGDRVLVDSLLSMVTAYRRHRAA